MRPSQVLDMHVDLLERLDDYKFRAGITATISAELALQVDQTTYDRQMADAVTEEFASRMGTAARAAYCYRVTETMVDLVEFAAASLEEDDTWSRDLAPTGCGLVHFDRPLVIGEVDGQDATVDWLLWGPGPVVGGKPRTVLFWFTDFARTDDPYVAWNDRQEWGPAARSVLGRWLLTGWDAYAEGRSLGPPTLDWDDMRPGTEWGAQTALTLAAEGRKGGEQRNDARLAHALWLLLDQTITALHDEPLERASKRRAVRKGLPPRVTTIALRRTEHRPAEGETHVEWQHRWIVRGHWRWQACGPNRSERRRIWISPFVKGPEDKPLKQSEKVYDLRR